MHHAARFGLALAAIGAVILLRSWISFRLRDSARGRRLANSSAEERRGVPFANKQYYDERWAPALAGVGAVLLLFGVIWFLVEGL